MNPALAGVALAVVVGAVIAGSARNARTAIFGLVITMVGVPLLADPVAAPLPLAARLVGRGPGRLPAVDRDPRPAGPDRRLAASAGRPRRSSPSRRRPSATAATASGRRRRVRRWPRAAGFALAALAVLPVVTGRDILRIGLGLGLLLGGALLVRTSLGGTPDPIEQLMTAGLVATLGGAVAILAIAARSDGGSGFELSATTPRRPGHVSDAHPADAHPADADPADQAEPG